MRDPWRHQPICLPTEVQAIVSGSSLRFRDTACWCIACLIAVNLLAAPSNAELQVDATSHARVGDGPLHAYVASVALPADGLWRIRAPESADSIRELYLVPAQPARLRQLGKRMYAALQERQVQAGRSQVQRGFEACRAFAQERDGVGPNSIDDFADDTRWKYLADHWAATHHRTRDLKDFMDDTPLEGPFVHLIPQVPFHFAEPAPPASVPFQRLPSAGVRKTVPKKDRLVLAFELRPFVDDGKHWVLFTDGSCEHLEIDPEFVKTQQIKIRPMMGKDEAEAAAQRPSLPYTLVLVASEPLASEPLTKPLQLEAYNQVLDQNLEIAWDAATASETAYNEIRTSIADARKFAWEPYMMASRGGVLNMWDQSAVANDPANDPAENPARSLSMFSVLGGRAAIEETLQLQTLTVTKSAQTEMVDVDSLVGVEVKSHPFEEMLGGQSGGSLEMARYVPPDRFFVYVGKPESISALLDTGAPFIASMGTALTGNCLQYNLESRYLARLGMTRDWVDAVLKSGLTSEMAVFAPICSSSTVPM